MLESELFDPSLQSSSPKYEIYDWVESVVFAVVCMILIFTFFGRNISVQGDSMLPTLHNEDRLIVSRFLYTPEYGDIVVVTQPNNRNEPLIKRVIATEGQEVDIDFTKGIVYVNGIPLDEPYTMAPTTSQYDVVFPQIVPEGKVFIMGDNRNDSWDSRDAGVGMVDERYILGRVLYRMLPWSNRGQPDHYWKTRNAV